MGSESFIPFLYPGWYHNTETNLAYNRFRYYSSESGTYVSQDPIGLIRGMNVYSYVRDTNGWVDLFGLSDLFIFGNTNAQEKVMINGEWKRDIMVVDGNVSVQACDPDNGIWPDGKSATTQLEGGLTGQVYQINDPTNLPKGLAIVEDGSDVGGPRGSGHHMIYPTEDMSFEEFNRKLK